MWHWSSSSSRRHWQHHHSSNRRLNHHHHHSSSSSSSSNSRRRNYRQKQHNHSWVTVAAATARGGTNGTNPMAPNQSATAGSTATTITSTAAAAASATFWDLQAGGWAAHNCTWLLQDKPPCGDVVVQPLCRAVYASGANWYELHSPRHALRVCGKHTTITYKLLGRSASISCDNAVDNGGMLLAAWTGPTRERQNVKLCFLGQRVSLCPPPPLPPYSSPPSPPPLLPPLLTGACWCPS